MAWTLADLGRQVRQAVFSKLEVPGLAHSVPGTVPRMTWELHLLLLLGLGLRSQEALPPPCERYGCGEAGYGEEDKSGRLG